VIRVPYEARKDLYWVTFLTSELLYIEMWIKGDQAEPITMTNLKELRSELHYPTVTSKITSLRFLSFEIFKAFKFFYDIQISLCDQSKMFLSIHGTMTWLPRLPLKQSPCVLNYDQNRDSIWFMLIIVWFFHFCGILIRSNYISMIHESEVRTYVEQWQVQWHNIQGIQIMIQYE